MVENEVKGWFGSFSNAGRNSAEKYSVIIHKDEILNDEHKKKNMNSAFTPDTELSNDDDSFDDHIDIFKLPNTIEMHPSQSMKKLTSSKSERLKFHNKHLEEIKNHPKKPENPPNKYNPKMDYIWNRTISGPQWRQVKSKKNPSIDSGFYMKHEDLKNIKGFIELSKQTMRGPGLPQGDVRVKHQRKYERNKRTLTSIKSTLSLQFDHEGRKSKSKLSPMKITADLAAKVNNNNFKSALDGKKCFVPDFQKNLSRDMLDQRFIVPQDEKPLCSPKYDVIRERQVMLVTYAKPSYIRKQKKFIGINPGALDKINDKGQSHQHVNVPIFRSMVSRPSSNDPLPSYMKQIFSRASGISTTDKTLKMNNYADSKFINQCNSFYPKKSFNKAINLNLMSSEKFSLNRNNSSEFSQLGNYLSKAMTFYRKNYDDLEKSNKITKFDSVTLKAIPKKNRNISDKHLQNFLINFDQDYSF